MRWQIAMSSSLLLAASDTSDKFVDLDMHLYEWSALIGFITLLLVVDLLVVHREAHEIHFREAAIERAIWISIGVAFTGVIFLIGGDDGGAGRGSARTRASCGHRASGSGDWTRCA